ncbi:MAG: hypothetical protein OYH77_06860 [Pseudomonadota bacterium]|nr:hypothetical protein [Pseudomonadota bacterium]
MIKFSKIRGLVAALCTCAIVIACGVYHDSIKKYAAEHSESNDDYGGIRLDGTALPDSVLPTQMYVNTAYASVDPSDLLLIEVIFADSIGSHKAKSALATAIPEILKEVINSNWVIEIRSMSDLTANPFATVGKYSDTYVYRDMLQQGVEKFTPALSRRNIGDRTIRLPIYLIISDHDLTSDERQRLDTYISKDPRRRIYVLTNDSSLDSFLAWRESDNDKKMVDYSADLGIKDLNVVMREFSGYIADTLRSNFHLGFCYGRRNSYERNPRTMSVALKFYRSDGGYVGEDSYHLNDGDDSLFIKSSLNNKVCMEASYIYSMAADNQQICRAMH